MTVERFNGIVDKVTKQFETHCQKNKITNWEKQKEFLTTILIRNKLLGTEQVSEFWRATGSTCDFVDMPNRKNKDKDYKWEVDVVFCILYIEHCMKKWTNRKVKVDEYT